MTISRFVVPSIFIEQPANRFIFVDVSYGLGDENVYAQHLDLVDLFLGGKRYRVRYDDLFDGALLDSFDRLTA